MRWAPILLLFSTTVLFGVSAQSQPTGCSAASTYDFEIRDEEGRVTWAVPEMECVQFFDIVVNTPHGVRHIRGIGDVNAGTFLPSGGVAAIEAGVRQASARFADLGDYKIPDITILITGVSDRPATLVNGVWKHTPTAADASGARIPESGRCPIRLFALGPMDNEDLKKAIAHEMFHCLQFGTLSVAQMKNAAVWWREGSAEMFAFYVFPHRSSAFNREDDFRASLVEKRPIFRMDYDALFLFLFYHEQTGISGLLPLLRSMPSSAADSAQMAALRGMMANEQWLQFAQAYEDRKIRYTNGRLADFGPAISGENWTFATTSTQSSTLKPFVITPGYANYQCGKWANRLTPSDANISVKPSDTENWTKWPPETDCRDKGSEKYRMMAIETGSANRRVSVRAERRIACNNCIAGESRIDACLVGTWEQTGGGPLEFLQRMGIPPVTRDRMGTLRMIIRDDGTFTSQQVGIDYQLTVPYDERGPVIVDSAGQIQGASGRWSAAAGQIRSCFDSGGSGRATSVVRYPDGRTMSVPHTSHGYAGINGTASYSCSATSLQTSNPTPRGPMNYSFRRVSPPPAR